MGFIRILPPDKECLKMLRSGMTQKDILAKYNMIGTSSHALIKLIYKYDIPTTRIKREFNKKKVGGVTIKTTRSDYEDLKDNNEYQQMDNYKVDQIIQLGGRKWVIDEVICNKSKMYKCSRKVNDNVIVECFNCLDLRRGNLL